jgi:NitT/TauT family transport system substrate-binding protein
VTSTTLRYFAVVAAPRAARTKTLKIGLLGLAAAACLSAGGCKPADIAPRLAAATSPPIRLATYEWPGSYWIEVATAKGWFAEAGLNVQRVDVDTHYFESLEDVATGKLDAMGFTQFDLVRHVAAGEDLVGVAAIDYSEGAEAMVAKRGISRLQDLKGKRLAVLRGTYLEYLLSVVAEREGLNLSDLTLVDLSEEAAMAAFAAGTVDAVFVWEPYGTRAIAAGGVRLFSTADFPGLTYSVLTLRHGFIESYPQQVAALIQVWYRSERYVHENPEKACAIVAQLFKEPYSDVHDLLRTVRILDLADNGRAFSYAAGFESLHGSWRRMNDFMLDRGLVKARVDSPAHLDASFIRQLE